MNNRMPTNQPIPRTSCTHDGKRTRTTNILKSSALAVVIALMFPAAGYCNAIVNGDFSAGTAGYVFTGNVGVFNSAQYDACCASGDTGTGNFAAFGGSDGPDDGQVTQTIITMPGQEYLLAFQYGAFSSPTALGTQSISITAGNLNTTLISAMSSRDLSLVLSSYQYDFQANSASTTLSFKDASTSTHSIDGLLDHIDVESVAPEPSSLLLLSTGLLGVSKFCRTRSRRPHVSRSGD